MNVGFGDDLSYRSARSLAAGVAEREFSTAELVDVHLGRIEALNPALGAVVSVEAEQAREAATAADRLIARRKGIGPLHGVPFVVKDGHDAQGLRTTPGTTRLDRIADRDGTVVSRLRAAGAIVTGHTNVPPQLAGYHSDNDLFGRTSNPWNQDRTPGGSTGGGAAALAAGLTPIEVGSDSGGSLRLPPHFCGVYGLMATERRIPLTGFWAPPPGMPRLLRSLMSLGPMARDLDDLELILRVVSGPDGSDTDVPPVPLGKRSGRDLTGLRIAVAPELPGAAVSPALRAEVERIAGAAEQAGARVEYEVPDLDWRDQNILGETMMAVTAAFDHEVEVPAKFRTLAWYLEALERRDVFIAQCQRFFATYDVLITPPGTTTAFAHDDDLAELDQGFQLFFANLGGLPVLTAPAGISVGGLPIGVQIVGPRWSELRLLDVAAALEKAGILPGFTRPPGY